MSRQSTFKRNAHINYFLRCLMALPSQAEGHDSNRITIAYFCLCGLDLLGALEEKTTEKTRQEWVDWVWSLQAPEGGFRGSTFLTVPDDSTSYPSSSYNPPHLPSTYTALLVLAILRAGLSRLDIDGLERFVDSCREEDGSYSPLPTAFSSHSSRTSQREATFESDARMTYCASVIQDILSYLARRKSSGSDIGTEISSKVDNGKGKSREKTVEWIKKCQTWEGGFGARPGLEAQGGTSYCSISSLTILTRHSNNNKNEMTSPSSSIDSPIPPEISLPALRFLTQRQVVDGQGGFQGRSGKDEDVCYSFWCGGAIRVLTGRGLFDMDSNRQALLDNQSPVGGFGKVAGEYPDPFHSYLAIAALAMLDNDEETTNTHSLALKPLDPLWNVSMTTKEWIIGHQAS